MAKMRVRKEVMLLMEREDMAIMILRNDVILLRERGTWL